MEGPYKYSGQRRRSLCMAAIVLGLLASTRTASAHPHYISYETAMESIKIYDELLKKHPDDLDLYYSKGEVLIVVGKLDEAEEQFQYVLKKDPDDDVAWLFLAKVEYDRKNYEKALELLKKVREGAIDYDRLVIEALAQIELKDFKRALAAADEAIRIDRELFPEAFLAKGIAQRALGRSENAVELVQQAFDIGLDVNFDYNWFRDIINRFFSRKERIVILNRLIVSLPPESPTAEQVKKDIQELKKEKEKK